MQAGSLNFKLLSEGGEENLIGLELNPIGYTAFQADLKVQAAEHIASIILSWNPYGEDYAEIGITTDHLGQLRAFAKIWNYGTIWHAEYELCQFATYYTFKMKWDGGTVSFFIDGEKKGSYTPNPGDIIFPDTRNFDIDVRAEDSGSINSYVDNFSVAD